MCFYCLLDIGTILKVVSIPRGSWHDLEEVLLEEMTVFRVSYPLITCVTSLGYGCRICHHQSVVLSLCHSLQEPTAIKAMELSTKQVCNEMLFTV